MFSGFWVTSLGTAASRVLGLVRDMATASLFGLHAGGVSDALVVAFRTANVLRRLLGEGALATSYLPVLVRRLDDRREAWRLTTALVAILAGVLAGCVLVGELLLAGLWLASGSSPGVSLLVGLSAVQLPYLWFICLAAQLSTTLQALSKFAIPALSPILLNLGWLAAVWLAPYWSSDAVDQAYLLSVTILVCGLLQLLVLLPPLWAAGFRWDFDWPAARAGVMEVVSSLVPITLALAVTQLNTLLDSLLAWGLAVDQPGTPISWLGGRVNYPLTTGAAAAIYYGERFYQLPVGLLGQTIATVFYPLLSRSAASNDRAAVGRDLAMGLRLTWFLTLPASAGLVLLARPAAELIFERGQFTADDAARTARMIACYSSAAWAYCSLPVLVRGYYAVGDRRTPALSSLAAVGLNVVLNLTLIWPLAEMGLAISTAIAAVLQTVWLTVRFHRRVAAMPAAEVRRSIVRTVYCTAVMAVAVGVLVSLMSEAPSRWIQAAELVIAIAIGIALYVGMAHKLRAEELKWLLRRRTSKSQHHSPPGTPGERGRG